MALYAQILFATPKLPEAPMLVYRNVATVMAAMIFLQVAAGSLHVALPLAMDAADWSAVAIGAVVASYAAGFMAGAWTAPWVIRTIGHIRAYAAYAGGAAAVTLMLALGSDFAFWAIARFGFGVCAAGIFAVSESWIADATPSERRGAVISVYQILGRAGLIAGPFLVALPPFDLTDGFIIAGIFLSLSLVPIVFTRRSQPALPQSETASPLRLFDIAPSAAAAVFVAGVVNSGLLAFIPIWAEGLTPGFGVEAGASVGAAAVVVAVVYFCSILTQWPAGVISDRFDRRLVIAALAALAAVAAVVLAVVPSPSLLTGALLAGAWGAASLAYYGVAVAHAADRSRVEELPSIASGLLLVWAAGSIVGPILAGVAWAGPLGATGLFLFAAVFSALLSAGMLVRRRQREPVQDADRESFVYLAATSSELAEIEAPETAEAGAREAW
ncbi:MFS transporter [Maricaulaceae bacterium MS644]